MSAEPTKQEPNQVNCPICDNLFIQDEIEKHVNKCIFLNCSDDQTKRKRSPSPIIQASKPKFTFKQRSPGDVQSSSRQTSVGNNSTVKTPLLFNLSRNTSEKLDNKEPEHSSNSSSSSKVQDTLKKKYDKSFKVPLAMQVRPKTLDDFFGQDHILGKGTVLRCLLDKGDIPNMILWGPPGCGKTSLSHVIQEMCKSAPTKWKFISLSATTSGIKDVQNAVTIAKNDLKFGKRTVLFMDEIHRFNKKQQDVFLLSVEKGDIILIGATTENPSFSINNALMSRCKVIVLEKLNSDDLCCILEKAAEFFDVDLIDTDNPAGNFEYKDAGLTIEYKALKWLADISDGDARDALSNLQLVINYFNEHPDKIVTVKDVEDKLKRAHLLYDKTGEEHYNIISAMHKSIRGSDENAALYWTTRMILSGEDPRYIARRMVRAASEDIGNADPSALPLAIATMEGCQLIGMPEADVLLAQCAIYLARAPKSREADSALARAKALIQQHKGPQPVVPMHIRNAPTKLMKNLGYGQLQNGEEFTFMPPEYKDVDFFS
ncbi:ATPase WRNIP1-like [Sitophilus oryzae]|uniref:ATPase WRNIP1-like n=1 Tax=Sitophilus oryzae TaxID=7048 RepID=A0A6J2XUE1_SITOR|nr:ATPase WRNIP1-like [Sitophilus oryzae]XP_030755187.1 ATPase WRNIP1-like [Sitophilus oryzae]